MVDIIRLIKGKSIPFKSDTTKVLDRNVSDIESEMVDELHEILVRNLVETLSTGSELIMLRGGLLLEFTKLYSILVFLDDILADLSHFSWDSLSF